MLFWPQVTAAELTPDCSKAGAARSLTVETTTPRRYAQAQGKIAKEIYLTLTVINGLLTPFLVSVE